MCKKDNCIGFAIGILAGVVGGIAAGLLCAPKPGKESRAEIKKTVIEMSEKYSPEILRAKKQAFELIKTARESLEEQYIRYADCIKAQKLADAKNLETEVYDI